MTNEQRQVIRQQLAFMGPEAVRKGMVAFEHKEGNGSCLPTKICCFLTHAYESTDIVALRKRLNISDPYIGSPFVECAFEGYFPFARDHTREEARNDLKQACIAFLAEHGKAEEPQVVVEAGQV